MEKKTSISVVIPAYNEAANLAAAVESACAAAEKHFRDYEILVIDDASTDGTGELADRLAAANPRVKVTHNAENKGFGYNYRLGARQAAMDYVGVLPGDNEITAESVDAIFALTGTADMVLPYHANAAERSLFRRALSGAFTALINLLFGHSLRYYNGPVIHRRELLASAPMTTDGFAYQAEILLHLLRRGHSYVETGMNIRSRQHGHSKALYPVNVWRVFSTVGRLFWRLRIAGGGPEDIPAPAFWGLLALAFALRAAYVWHNQVLPWNDMAMWDEARRAILDGKGYSAGWTPLYTLSLVLITKLFGESYRLMNLFNAALSTLTCYFIYLTARDLFGRRAAFLALAVSAVYVDMIWYCAVMLGETMGVLLLSVAVWRLAAGRGLALAGVFFGLACLTKGVFIIAMPALLLWVWLRAEGAARLKRAALFAGFAFLTIAPWSVRNRLVQQDPSLLEPTAMGTIFVGHNPYATGGADFEFALHDYGKFYHDPNITDAERDRIYKEKVIEFITTQPLAEIPLTLKKISKHLTFATSFAFYRAEYPARKLMFAASLLQNMAVFMLCAFGMALAWRDRKSAGLSAIIGIYVLVFVTLFCAEGRKRMPFIPSAIVLAAYAAAALPGAIAAVKAGRGGPLRGRLAAGAAAAALLFLNFVYQTATRYADVAKRFG